jgi:hypothetical protein
MTVLAGGSGGGGGAANTLTGTYDGGAGAGAGGGAVLIHASGDVSVAGAINANGGNAGATQRGGNGGAGSGGAIVIRSNGRVSVAGSLTALGGDGLVNGGAGGQGRIRLEDTVGSFMPGTIAPALTKGAFSTSVATSTWIRLQASGAPATGRVLAIVDSGSAAGSSAYAVEVDAANDAGGTPDATTETGFTQDTTRLQGKEWVRFRITFKSDAKAALPSVDRVFVPFKQ